MTTKRNTKKKKKIYGYYSDKAVAQRKAARLRAEGKQARVRRDPITGKWIVEIFILVATLGLLSSFFRQR